MKKIIKIIICSLAFVSGFVYGARKKTNKLGVASSKRSLPESKVNQLFDAIAHKNLDIIKALMNKYQVDPGFIPKESLEQIQSGSEKDVQQRTITESKEKGLQRNVRSKSGRKRRKINWLLSLLLLQINCLKQL